jgi:beta-lactam-binding protein with PASTA domain
MKTGSIAAITPLCLALGIFVWVWGCVSQGTPATHSDTSVSGSYVATIVSVYGPDVTVDSRPAASGMRIYPDENIRTGAASEVTIRLKNGAILHVYENSDPIFDIIIEPLCLLIRMFYGKAMLDTNNSCVHTDTPESQALINSVIFIGIRDGLTRYEVLKGRIQVSAKALPNDRISLSAGQGIDVTPERTMAPYHLSPQKLQELHERYEQQIFRLPKSTMIPLPDFRGWPVEKAQDRLTILGLRWKTKPIQTREHPHGVVIDQDPAPGAGLQRGDTVWLGVADHGRIPPPENPPQAPGGGEGGLYMPNFIGRPIRDAMEQLQNAGFKGRIENLATRKYPPGVVVKQSPAPGKLVRRGQLVVLGVETDRPAENTPDRPAVKVIRCPDLRKQFRQPAIEILKELNLKWTIELFQNSRLKPDMVVDQTPPPGAEMRPGDIVRLKVTAGGENTMTSPGGIKIID